MCSFIRLLINLQRQHIVHKKLSTSVLIPKIMFIIFRSKMFCFGFLVWSCIFKLKLFKNFECSEKLKKENCCAGKANILFNIQTSKKQEKTDVLTSHQNQQKYNKQATRKLKSGCARKANSSIYKHAASERQWEL